jgi:hypothetical protein
MWGITTHFTLDEDEYGKLLVWYSGERQSKGKVIPVQAYCRPTGFQEVEAPRFLDIRRMTVVNVISPVHRPPVEIIPATSCAAVRWLRIVRRNYDAIMREKLDNVRHSAIYSLCFLIPSEKVLTSSFCASAARHSQGRTSMSQQETGHTKQSGSSVCGFRLHRDRIGWQVRQSVHTLLRCLTMFTV